MKFNALHSNFASGYWSARMRSRSDAEAYKNSCKRIKNFIPTLQGGALKRPGTMVQSALGSLVASMYEGAPKKLIVASIVDTDNEIDEWVLAFNGDGSLPGPYAIRLSDAQLRAITPGTAIDVSVDASFTPRGDEHHASFNNFVLVTFPDGDKEPRVITRIRATASGASLADTRNFEMYRWSDFCKQITTLGYDYGLYQPKEWHGYPFLQRNINGTAGTITLSGTVTVGGTITLTSSVPLFNASHKRSLWKLGHTSVTPNEGVVRLTSITSSTVAVGVVLSAFTALGTISAYGGNATSWWSESAWNDFRGWPRSVTNYQGRLIFGGSPDQPMALWGSKIGAPFYFFEVPLIQDDTSGAYLDDNSRSFTLIPDTPEASDIRGVVGHDRLVIHTDKYEIVGRGTQGALGPVDAEFKSTTSYGCAKVQPVRIGSTVIYLQATSKTIREVVYNFDTDQYISPDLGFVADDLLYENTSNIPLVSVQEYRIRQFAYMREPSILWCLLTEGNGLSGKVVGLHLDKEYKFNAWFELELTHLPLGIVSIACSKDTLFMGTTSDGDLWGPILKMGSIPNFMGYDEMETVFSGRLELVCLDNMASPTETPDGTITTFTCPAIYSGETVSVMADRKHMGEFTVDPVTNEIELPWAPTTEVIIGYRYNADLELSPVELGNQIPDSSHGRVKRIDEVIFSFYRSFGAKYGKDFDSLFDLDFLDFSSYDQSEPLPLFTGQIVRSLDAGYDRQFSMCVRSDSPYPCNLLSITARGVTYD